jgi:HK97 family phage prohead protease
LTEAGIRVKARIAKIDEPGEAQTLCDKAWHSVRAGLVQGLSIGFKPLKAEPIKTGYRYLSWRWHELSLVTVPAHPSARIAVAR